MATSRRIIPTPEFNFSAKLSKIPQKSIQHLSKEQLAQRRIEVMKYYSDLSRNNLRKINTPENVKKNDLNRKNVQKVNFQQKAPPSPKIQITRRERKINEKGDYNRQFQRNKNFKYPKMSSVIEKPGEEIWEQIKGLTSELSKIEGFKISKTDGQNTLQILNELLE